MTLRDLFVVVADLDAENAVKTLLSQRQEALGIHLDFDPEIDLLRYAGRDSGCYKNAVDLLRSHQTSHRHAMLCFDRDGSGAEQKGREEIETEIERHLCASGWPENQAVVVVFDPELEIWVWSDSPRVADALGWAEQREALRPFLHDKGLWMPEMAKPSDPKEAMVEALRHVRQPRVAPLFSEMARTVGVRRCQVSSFNKFRKTLVQWFPR